MDIESKLDHIVEPFDQKDGPDLGSRQAKTYGVRTRLISPSMGQIVISKKDSKKNVVSLICNRESNLNRSSAAGFTVHEIVPLSADTI